NSRAATKPSPPLLPGPQRTLIGCTDQRRETASATARPAFSIRVVPEMPLAIVSPSASAICWGVRRECLYQPSVETLMSMNVGSAPPTGTPGLDAVLASRYLGGRRRV